jgi:hypothetical protein
MARRLWCQLPVKSTGYSERNGACFSEGDFLVGQSVGHFPGASGLEEICYCVFRTYVPQDKPGGAAASSAASAGGVSGAGACAGSEVGAGRGRPKRQINHQLPRPEAVRRGEMSRIQAKDGVIYCAVRKIGDRSPGTAQSGGESEEGRRPAPLGRVPAPEAWVRGEGRGLAACPASPRAFPANEAARANV